MTLADYCMPAGKERPCQAEGFPQPFFKGRAGASQLIWTGNKASLGRSHEEAL